MLFFKLMNEGGPLMWVIFGCTMIAFFIILVKILQFHREEINVRELMHGLFNVLQREGLVEALTLCDTTPGPVARLLDAGIRAHQRGEENIRQELDNAALEELPKLERLLAFLGTLTYILPLLGLLGTVLGMLDAFETIKASQYFSAGAVGGPVAKALLTTAAGLSSAILCHIGYNYLVSRVEAITLDMEKAALELEAFFERLRSSKVDK